MVPPIAAIMAPPKIASPSDERLAAPAPDAITRASSRPGQVRRARERRSKRLGSTDKERKTVTDPDTGETFDVEKVEGGWNRVKPGA